jgi:hypothetical protein
MVREMGLAVLAAVDLVRVQVDVVGQPHLCSGWALGLLYFVLVALMLGCLEIRQPAGWAMLGL